MKFAAVLLSIAFLTALPTDDPVQRQPDITLARSRLDGWEPAVRLEDGLKKTIAYFEAFLKSP